MENTLGQIDPTDIRATAKSPPPGGGEATNLNPRSWRTGYGHQPAVQIWQDEPADYARGLGC